MAAHLYWRLNISASNGGGLVSIGELGMYTAGAASSSTTGGTASASTTNSTNAAANAFDGNTGTYWQATGPTGTIQYQFASPVDIAVYSVTNMVTASLAPKAWTLEYSDDGVSWTVADTVARQTFWSGNTGSFETRYYTVGANAGNTEFSSSVQSLRTTNGIGSLVGIGGRTMNTRSAESSTTVSGIAKENNVVKAGIIAVAHDKVSKQPLGWAVTAADGSYSINCGGFTNVYVVFLDPVTFQGIVFDEVTPG